MPTITTDTTGHVEAQSDKEIVQFGVQERHDDANTARAALAERIPEIRSALAELDIPEDNIQTSSYNLKPRPPRSKDDDTDSSRYVATQKFTVEVETLELTGQIIDTVTEHGANRINGVTHTFTETTRQRLRHDALEVAMNNARQQAEILADQADLTIVGVETVNSSELDVPTRRSVGRAPTESGQQLAGGTEIDSGPLTVTATVEVTYSATRN